MPIRVRIAAYLAFLVSAHATAQSCGHTLVGRVTDQFGKPILGASIYVSGRNAWARSDSSGAYRICAVSIGSDSVTIVAVALGMRRMATPALATGHGEDTLNLRMSRPWGCWRTPQMDTALLAAAERRWKERRPHAYEFTVTESYNGPGRGSWRVTVRGDTVVSAVEMATPGAKRRRADVKHLAILVPSQLFERLRRRVTDSNYTTTVRYDEALGYPTMIGEEMNCTYDAGGTISLEDLRPIRP